MPAAGYQAGQAWIGISPSLRNFHRQIRQQLAKELGRDIEVPVKPKVVPPKDPNEPFRPYEKAAKKSGEDAGGAFARNFRQRVDAALRSIPEIHVDADTSEADTEIAGLRTRLQALRDLRIGVDLDAVDAQREIAEISAQLRRLAADDARLDVRADTAQAAAQLASISGQVERLDGKTAHVDVDVDRDGQAFRSSLFLTNQISGLVLAGAAIGPALVPGLGAAAVAAAGLASSLTAATFGVGGLIAAVAPAISAVSEAVQAQTAADKSAATSAVQSSQQRVQAAYAAQQAAERVADAQRSADRTAEDGARRVADARQAIVRAQEEVAESIAAAEQRLADSGVALAQAQREQLRAQEDLNRAREDAVRALEDMRERVSDLALTEEAAEIALLEAQQRMRDANGQTGTNDIADAQLDLLEARQRLDQVNKDSKASEIDRQRALLDVAKAEEALAKVQRDASDLALDRRKTALDVAEAEERLSDILRDKARATADLNEAERLGIDGSDQVVSAQQRLEDATLSTARATRENQEAQAELAEAQVEAARTVADAEEELALARQQAAEANADAARQVSQALAAQAQQAEMANAQGAQGTAAMRNLAYAMGELTPLQRELMEGWLSLREAFQSWSRALEPSTIPVLTKGMSLLERLLPLLTPIVESAAAAFSGLLDSADAALTDPFWQDFFGFLGSEAGPSITMFARVLGNLAKGFAGIMMAFAPVSRELGAGLVRLTERFATWGATLNGSDGFAAFIDYVRQSWPQLKATLSALWSAIGNIVEAMAPLGGPVLVALEAVFGVIGSMPPSLLAAIAGGLIGIGTAFKFVGVAMAVLKANPIILIIAAVTSLATWLVHTWQTSETFRDRVTGALRVVQTVAGAVWGFLDQWVIRPLVAGFTWVWNTAVAVANGVVGAFRAVRDGLGAAYTWLRDNVFNPVIGWFQNIWDKAVAVKDGIVAAWTTVSETIGAAFSGIWDGIKTALNAVFGFINRWMIRPLNAIISPFGLEIPQIGLITMHTGGMVPGRGETPRMLLGGEAVLNRAATAAIGGKSAVDALNTGRAAGLPHPEAMGGFEWPDWGTIWSALKVTDPRYRGIENALKIGVGKAVRGVIDPALADIDGVIAGPSFAERPSVGTARNMAREVKEWAADLDAGYARDGGDKGTGTIGKNGIAFPLPAGSYRVGVGINGYPGHTGQDFPAPVGTPVYSPIAGMFSGVNLGNRSYGRYANVVSGGTRFIGAHLSALSGGNRMVAAGERIGSVGSTGNSTGPHLHAEFRANGIVQDPKKYLTFDSGGNLMPGMTLAYNGTGQRERILDPRETRAYEQQGAGRQTNNHFYGSKESLIGEVIFAIETRQSDDLSRVGS